MAYRRTPAIQARLDAQHAALLRAAEMLLAEGGFAACSIAAVASRAAVSAGTVYRHFPSKTELIAQTFRAVASREVAAVRDAVQAESSAGERSRAVIETFAGRAMKSPRLAYALLAEPVEAVIDALRLEFRIAFRDVVRGLIASAVRSGELPPQNDTVVAAALVGAIGEALVGPLATRCEDPDTVPSLIAFAHRAIGVVDAAHA